MKMLFPTSFMLFFGSAYARVRPFAIPLALALILLIGAALRLSDFSSLTRFNADQVRDAGIIDAMVYDHELPLLGPKAGGTTFQLGPAFYYLEYLSGSLFGYTPEGIAFFVPLFSLLSIYILFRLLRFVFTPWLSLLLTLLYATSFYSIKYARFAWNPNPIPVFVFAYLWLLTLITGKDHQKQPLWYALLALVMGIAMQLHTTLLILLPAGFVLTHLWLFFSEKRLPIRRILALCLLVACLQTPSILFDIQNQGKNAQAFLAGITTKTEQNTALTENFLLDVELFAQGSTYVLSGQEPAKNWLRPLKLIQSREIKEILLFLFGMLLILAGTVLTVTRLRKPRSETARRFLLLLSGFSLLSFVLFLPLGSELNLRFFIILLPLPFIFLGLIIEYFLAVSQPLMRPIFPKIFVVLFLLTLVALNLHAFRLTYNLNDYRAKESAYGGISLGEAQAITAFITATKQSSSSETEWLLPFEFERSIKYLAKREGVLLKSMKREALPENALAFLITPRSTPSPNSSDTSFPLETLAKNDIGRFSVFLVRLQRAPQH
jgi:4-amino-4-deoxy-L-arabinose transferase-like glycosyltransferase